MTTAASPQRRHAPPAGTTPHAARSSQAGRRPGRRGCRPVARAAILDPATSIAVFSPHGRRCRA